MAGSLWSGISGLNASGKQMDIIGNNIANVNTVGLHELFVGREFRIKELRGRVRELEEGLKLET